MSKLKKYAAGSSSHQSMGIIIEKMQQEIYSGQTGKAKSKVQRSVKANYKMKVEDRYTVHIKSSTKVEMAGTNFQSSVKIKEQKTEMIEFSNSSGHTNWNVGRLMLPSLEIGSTAHDSDRKRKRVESKGQVKKTGPVRKSSNQRSGTCTCHKTRTGTKRTSTKTSTRKEKKSTETRSNTQLGCTYVDVSDDTWESDTWDYAYY
ncbi:hypothetical protein I3843_10G098600 [Carya illinoinensis]|nr:uncharacterized protein LOC122278117 [Carya illinoinensis]KAG7959998.1 hypothetical protein I3843_10G098600 [Carya illinoinensis]